MPKSAGYLRGYRAARLANKGKPLGPRLGAAAAGEIDILVNSYGYTPAKARQEVITVNRMLRDQAAIMKGDMSKIAPPRGRAPRGMGSEWAARRQIADLLKKANSREDNAWGRRQSYRGTKRGRYDDSRRSETTGVMRKFRSETKRIVQGPGSWVSKHKAIKDQYEYVNYLMRG